MSLIPDRPSLGDKPDHLLTKIALAGQLGGPSYTYRDARIDWMNGGHVCRLTMDGHPLTGIPLGVVGMITPLIEQWLEAHQPPSHIRSGA